MEMAKSQSSRGQSGTNGGKNVGDVGVRHGGADKSTGRATGRPVRAAKATTSTQPARKEAPATAPVVFGSARAILRGEMDKVGLCTLLTILEMERRTGILVLQRPRQLGRLHVRDGQIIRARIEGQAARQSTGAEAVYQMLTWPDGQFELWQAEVEGRDEIRQRTAYLLMEGMRRLDEGQNGVHNGVLAADAAPSGAPLSQLSDARPAERRPAPGPNGRGRGRGRGRAGIRLPTAVVSGRQSG